MFLYTAPSFALRTGTYYMALFTGAIPEDPQEFADLNPCELFTRSNAFLGCTGATSSVNKTMLELTKLLTFEAPSTKEPFYHEALKRCVLPIKGMDIVFEGADYLNAVQRQNMLASLYRSMYYDGTGSSIQLTAVPTSTIINFELVEESVVTSIIYDVTTISHVASTFDLEYFDGTDWVAIQTARTRSLTNDIKFAAPITASKFRIKFSNVSYTSAYFSIKNLIVMADSVPETYTTQGPITHAVLTYSNPSLESDIVYNYGTEVPMFLLHAGGPYDGKPVSLSTSLPDPEIELGLLNCRIGCNLMETV